MIPHLHWAALYRREGPDETIRRAREMFGLHKNADKGYHVTAEGRPFLKNPSQPLRDASLRSMALGIFGHENFEALFNPINRVGRATFEDTGGIGPGVFANINTFTGLATGLYEVAVLEGYEVATLDADRLVQIEPARTIGSRKKIGIGNYINQARYRLPNMQTPRATLTEQWITIPETQERALALDLTREVVFSDITGDLVDGGTRIGEAVGWLRAKDIYDVVLGINNNYKYKDTTYNTYQTAAGTAPAPNNYVNKFVNPIVDSLTTFQAARAKFAQMKDPISYQPVVITPNRIVVMPPKQDLMQLLVSSTQIRVGDGASATVATYGAAPNRTYGDVIANAYIYQRVIDPDGLNLGAAGTTNTDGLWLWGNFQRAFGLAENWGLSTVAAPADSYIMLDQGLVNSWFSNERSQPYAKDPRFVTMNTAT